MAYNNNQNTCDNNFTLNPNRNATLRITNNTNKNIKIVDTGSGKLFVVESNCTANIINFEIQPITKISIIRTIDCDDKCEGCNNVTLTNLGTTTMTISDPQVNDTRTISLPANNTTNISNKITNNNGQFCATIDSIVFESPRANVSEIINPSNLPLPVS